MSVKSDFEQLAADMWPGVNPSPAHRAVAECIFISGYAAGVRRLQNILRGRMTPRASVQIGLVDGELQAYYQQLRVAPPPAGQPPSAPTPP